MLASMCSVSTCCLCTTVGMNQPAQDAVLRQVAIVAGIIALSTLVVRADDASPTDRRRVTAMLQATDPVVWLFTGDSITLGARHTYGHRSYTEHVAERLRGELVRRRDIVINTAISGDRVADLASDLEHRVFRFQPQVFSLMLGMNDAPAGPAAATNSAFVSTPMHSVRGRRLDRTHM